MVRDLGLGDEALPNRWVGGVPVGQDLERDLAAESEIGCRVHDGRMTSMNRLVESVLVDDLPRLKCHRMPLAVGV